MDEPEAAVEFPTAVSYHSVAAQQQTRVEAVMGAGERVELQWTPRVKRAAEIAATVFCRNATLVSFTGGVMGLRSVFDYQVTQGELREARVRIPAGQRLLRVEGESIRTWQIRPTPNPSQEGNAAGGPDTGLPSSGGAGGGFTDSPGNEGGLLVVELLKGVSPGYRLTIETEKTIDTLPDNFAVETPHALDVKRETGFVALSSSDELGLTIENAQGLQKVDAVEFFKLIAQEKPLAAAYQFLKTGFALTVRVEPLQPQIEAIVRNRVRIGAEQIHLDARVDYTIKRAGLFALRLALPGDFRVENVVATPGLQQTTAADSRPQPPPLSWVEKTENDVHVLLVTLKQRTMGNCSLRRRDRNGEEWRVELQNKVVGTHLLTVTWEQPWNVREQGKEALFEAAGVEVLAVERETGLLAVIAKSPLQVAPKDASAELIRADVQELPDWAGRADESTVLVYRYLRPGYKLSVAAQRFAHAEVLQASLAPGFSRV